MNLETRLAMPQNVIAVVMDADKTLLPGYMQAPVFDEYGIDQDDFWQEVERIVESERAKGKYVQKDLAYLTYFLKKIHTPGHALYHLTTKRLRKLGKKLEFFPGVPGFFENIKQDIEHEGKNRQHGITVEYYIVSTGFADMLRGSCVAEAVGMDHIHGCEFYENRNGVPYGIAQGISPTEKTRVLFEINKGSAENAIDVNAIVPDEYRRVPFPHMVFLGDGPSDVPAFSVLRRFGGHTFVVYNPNDENPLKNAGPLHANGRADYLAPADYRRGSHLYVQLHWVLSNIARGIVTAREESLQRHVVQPPKHS